VKSRKIGPKVKVSGQISTFAQTTTHTRHKAKKWMVHLKGVKDSFQILFFFCKTNQNSSRAIDFSEISQLLAAQKL
jgi:hypothetical protein